MKATWNGAVLAESDRTVVVEGNQQLDSFSASRTVFDVPSRMVLIDTVDQQVPLPGVPTICQFQA